MKKQDKLTRRSFPRIGETALALCALLGLGYGTVLALQVPRASATAVFAQAPEEPEPPAEPVHASDDPAVATIDLEASSPSGSAGPVPEVFQSLIRRAIEEAVTIGDLPGLRPDVVRALAALEHTALAADSARMGRILARLEERLKTSPEDLEFILELLVRWPLEAKGSPVLNAVVKLLDGLGREDVRQRLVASLADRERHLLESRPRDPDSILVLLDRSADPVEALRTLDLLQPEDLEREDVRRRVEEILLGDAPTPLRTRALEALSRLGDANAARLVLELERTEADPDLRRALVRALTDWPAPIPEVSLRLLDLAGNDPQVEVRRFAAMAFEDVETNAANVRSWLNAFEIETDASVRFLLVKSAAPHIQAYDIGTLLLEILRSSNDPDLRAAAAMSLWKSPLGEVGSALEKAARSDPNPTVRAHAERALRVRRNRLS